MERVRIRIVGRGRSAAPHGGAHTYNAPQRPEAEDAGRALAAHYYCRFRPDTYRKHTTIDKRFRLLTAGMLG